MKKRVADIVTETLLSEGINNTFCVVGGGAMHLNNAFKIHEDMRVIYCHHEQACAFAAEGYAKYSGKMAAVLVTSGPGGVNTLNGVYSAYVDNTPMIVIAGHPRYDTTVEACGLKLRCRGVQEFDIIPAVQGMTKYAKLVKDPMTIRAEILKACHIAKTGRRGPVWLSIPLDIQASVIEEDELAEYKNEIALDSGFDDIDKIKKAVSMLSGAKRPCILAGSALRSAGAIELFRGLLEKLDIPVIAEAVTPDILPHGYKNYYGLSGSIGPRVGNYILQESDLILILGNSMSTRQTGFNVAGFAPNAKRIMVDIEHDEPFKPGLNIDLPIQMDINLFMQRLMAALLEPLKCPAAWHTYCDKVYAHFCDYDMPEVPADDSIPEKKFWDIFLDKIEEDAPIALGNSNAVVGVLQLGTRHLGQRVITNVNAGSMGYDLPEAAGVAVAVGKDKTVYCVTGDGSIMMNLQELQTIKYNELNIKVVVFSNNGYGAIRQTCKNYFNGEYAGCDADSGVDFPSFAQIAAAFGFAYQECKRYSYLADALDAFISAPGRVMLEVHEHLDDTVIPKIMSRLKEDGTFETPSFTDLSPFLSQEDQKILDEYRSFL